MNDLIQFAPKVGMFVGGCAIAVLVVGLFARGVIFEDARKGDHKDPSSTTPPRPEASGEPGVAAT
jgi:hypothetical protein